MLEGQPRFDLPITLRRDLLPLNKEPIVRCEGRIERVVGSLDTFGGTFTIMSRPDTHPGV